MCSWYESSQSDPAAAKLSMNGAKSNSSFAQPSKCSDTTLVSKHTKSVRERVKNGKRMLKLSVSERKPWLTKDVAAPSVCLSTCFLKFYQLSYLYGHGVRASAFYELQLSLMAFTPLKIMIINALMSSTSSPIHIFRLPVKYRNIRTNFVRSKPDCRLSQSMPWSEILPLELQKIIRRLESLA